MRHSFTRIYFAHSGQGTGSPSSRSRTEANASIHTGIPIGLRLASSDILRWDAPHATLFEANPYLGAMHTSDLYYLFDGTSKFNFLIIAYLATRDEVGRNLLQGLLLTHELYSGGQNASYTFRSFNTVYSNFQTLGAEVWVERGSSRYKNDWVLDVVRDVGQPQHLPKVYSVETVRRFALKDGILTSEYDARSHARGGG